MEGQIDIIIARVLSGESSEEDRIILENWLDKSPKNRTTFQVISQHWSDAGPHNHPHEKNTDPESLLVRERIWRKIKLDHRPAISFRKGYTVAATVSLVLLISALVFSLTITSEMEESPVTSIPEYVVNTNPPGQKSKVFLPDGSIAWLNANSELRYKKQFEQENRYIYLKGEAFFEVAKDPERPFIVQGGDVKTIALGTSFNVNAFGEQVEVTLYSGKIRLENCAEANCNDKNKTSLEVSETGMMARLNQEKINFEVEKIDITDINSWKDGVLVFNNASFDQVVEKIENWYGVSLTYNQRPGKSWNYTGKFSNYNLITVLESIQFTQNFSYEKQGDTVKIFFPNN